MRASVAAEKAGFPTTSIVLSGFLGQAKTVAQALGIKNLALAEYPGLVAMDSPDELRRKVTETVVKNIISGFTRQVELVDELHDFACVGSALGLLEGFDGLRQCADCAILGDTVFAAHLGLLAILHRILLRTGAEARHWVLVMGAAALNPAIYMNGPVWGQVDLLFSLPVALALAGLFEGFLLRWVLPLLAIAFLLKFQAVAAVPAFLGLLWIRRKEIAWGLLPALFVILISIEPFLAAGSLGRMIHGAYLSSVSSYPLATYNAANLWFLLGFNTLPDTLFLLDPTRDARGLELLLTPRYLGWMSYSAFAVWILVDGLRHRKNTRWWRNSVLAILGFFLVLPSMHERYLFLAVPIALVASAYHPRFLAIAGFVLLQPFRHHLDDAPPRGNSRACSCCFHLDLRPRDPAQERDPFGQGSGLGRSHLAALDRGKRVALDRRGGRHNR